MFPIHITPPKTPADRRLLLTPLSYRSLSLSPRNLQPHLEAQNLPQMHPFLTIALYTLHRSPSLKTLRYLFNGFKVPLRRPLKTEFVPFPSF